jgi:hypothetical protein
MIFATMRLHYLVNALPRYPEAFRQGFHRDLLASIHDSEQSLSSRHLFGHCRLAKKNVCLVIFLLTGVKGVFISMCVRAMVPTQREDKPMSEINLTGTTLEIRVIQISTVHWRWLVCAIEAPGVKPPHRATWGGIERSAAKAFAKALKKYKAIC